jgi:LysR family transcriptional regulator, glycine cleavage system transcriptional activator
MQRGRLPLTALRVFESAGRLLSFTRAADELFVTQAAVSRQIRDLEQNLGTPLFQRHHRHITLTASGARLLARVTSSFDALDEAVREVNPPARATVLVVSVEPYFAAAWLAPRIDRFRAIQPEVDVEILSEGQVVEFRTCPAQLAIRFSAGTTNWSRVEAQWLMHSVLTPVLSPSLMTEGPPLKHPDDLSQHNLLHEDSRKHWTIWLEKAGVTSAKVERGTLFGNAAGMVMAAAMRGHGVALGDLAFLEEDLEAGRLVAPFNLRVTIGSYWLVAPRFDALSPAALAFKNWLSASVVPYDDDVELPRDDAKLRQPSG